MIIDYLSVSSVPSVAQKIGEICEICGGILLNNLRLRLASTPRRVFSLSGYGSRLRRDECSLWLYSFVPQWLCGYESIMQNKPNFLKDQMNVYSFITKDYRKNDAFAVQKNKPNSKPNKANLPEGKIDAMCVFTKDYEEKCG